MSSEEEVSPQLIEVDKMPMPMDSQEVLQEFASDKNVIEEDVKNGNKVYLEEESEGWYKKYCRWAPTSAFLLEQAEKKVLSYIKAIPSRRFVDIGPVQAKNCKWSLWSHTEERKIWTVIFNQEKSEKTPILLVHGLCASLGLWALNIDALAEDRTVYAIDLMGFGRSSRPKFSSDPHEAEMQHVEAIEAWRKEMGLEKFILLGHSMGGFLSASYALKYPERVSHLILADPWGFPEKPENLETVLPLKPSFKLKAITAIGLRVNPLALVRAAGPMGPGLIGRARPDLVSKFEALNQDGSASVAEYIYHANAQNPSGEEAFRTMMDYFGWAKNPMVHRIPQLQGDMPLTMIYGGKTWLQQIPEDSLRRMRPQETHTEIHIVPGAGHHVYADDLSLFNSIVHHAASVADKLLNPTKIRMQDS